MTYIMENSVFQTAIGNTDETANAPSARPRTRGAKARLGRRRNAFAALSSEPSGVSPTMGETAAEGLHTLNRSSNFPKLKPDADGCSQPGKVVERLQNLCVIGLGHIGLPTALMFADAGLTVTGVDTNHDRVAMINAGRDPIGEAGLRPMLTAAIAAGSFVAAERPVRARAYILAVPTPLTSGNRPDLSYLWEAAAAMADLLTPGALVILESTSPIGTTERLASLLARLRPDLGFPGQRDADLPVTIAYCPERVLPGNILAELRVNDRVIGGLDEQSAIAATQLYRRIAHGQCHLTNAATAEMTKLAENAYRDVNIAYANELAAIAEDHDIDPRAVIALANRHPRVDILDPGPGVGGHCVAVDPWFLADAAPQDTHLIRSARAVNDARPGQIAARARSMIGSTTDPVIACFGLTYKRDVADLRESPAVAVVRQFLDGHDGTVLAVDPYITKLPDRIAGATLVEAGEALVRADLLILLVDHAAFRHLPVGSIPGLKILDTRGLWTLTDADLGSAASSDDVPHRGSVPRLVHDHDPARPVVRLSPPGALPAAAPHVKT